jgi:WD40 repeat protein
MPRNAVRLGCVLLLGALAVAGARPASGQPAKKVKRHEAFLEVLAPPGAKVSINGEDKGAERLFRYGPFPIVKPQRLKVEITLKDGEVVKRTVLLDAGWYVRLPVAAAGGTRPQVVLQTGHSARVNSASFSGDGKHVLTASSDKTAAVWDAATGARLLLLKGHTRGVSSASYSPDGRRIVTASWDTTAAVWDAATGARLLSLKGHTSAVRSASFSPDGRQVVTASEDGTPAVWDAATGAKLLSLEGHTRTVTSAVFSPDGKRIVTASWDRTAAVWDASSGAHLFSLKGHTSLVYAASYSPDGRRVVTASNDNTAAVWDAATGAKLLSLEGHTHTVTSAVFSPDGKRIVTTSWDRTAAVWDAATGARLLSLKGHTSWALSGSYSPDGRRVVTASDDGTAAVWDAATGARLLSLKGHTDVVYAASYSPDGKRVVTASADKTATVWDAVSGARLLLLKGHTEVVYAASFGPDGKRVVTASADKTVAIWDAATGARLLLLKGHNAWARSASFGPDGKRVVTASGDNTAAVWDTVSGVCLNLLQGHTGPVVSASYSPDGRQVVTASWDRTAAVWDAATGARLLSLEGHTSYATSASYSPDGKRVVTASRDRTAAVWDATTGARLLSLKGHTWDVSSASYSPDGKRIVTASWDDTAVVWDAGTGARLLSLKGHTGEVTSASFSRDGRRVLTASADGTARLWDAATGDEICCLFTFSQGRDWLAVTPEGLFDGSAGGREKVYYRVGKGLTVVPVDRFFQDFYRPGLLASLLRGERPMPEADFARQRPPLLRIVSPKAGGAVEKPLAEVVVEVTDQGGGASGPWLFHNGARVLAPGSAERKGKLTRRTFTVALVEGDNHLEARASSLDGSWDSEPARLTLRYQRPLPRPELYLVAVGVSKYADARLDLKFAARDARAIAGLFQKRGKALYTKVHVTALTDDKATKDGVAKAFAALKGKARPQDTLVVFLAGHGTMVGQRYYFLPHEFRPGKGALEASVRGQGLSHDLLADHLAAVPALRRVLVLDTCASGGALGLGKTARTPFALRGAVERLARNQGVHAIAAAAANDEAQEVKELGHGLLTYALLAGLKAADRGPLAEDWVRPSSAEGVVDVLEWFTFAAGRVPRLSKKYFGREQEVEQRSEGRSFPVLPLDER